MLEHIAPQTRLKINLLQNLRTNIRTIQRFNIMPIIEMIPPEYWRQIRKELNALGDALNPAELAHLESESQRRNRIAAEYDSAIERRKIENNRKSHRNRRK